MSAAEMKYTDSGIGRVADFTAAEEAVRAAFRWYCCEANADQKGCAHDCPLRKIIKGLDEGRETLLLRVPVAEERS